MKQYDDALGDLNRAIEICPVDDAFASRGQLYRAMGRYDEALADFDRAIELDPSDEDHVAKRAEILQLMDGRDDASGPFPPPSA
jgi:tetratricopeptide (TPR) repeat protein